MLNHKRISSNSPDQGELLPTFPSDLVADNHLARIVHEVVASLDLSQLYAAYSHEGGRMIHPKLLLNILFYAYSQGNRSSRQISQACRENHIYMYLSGCAKPNFRTVSEFRRKHIDLIQDLFKQIVLIGHKLGMVKMGEISLDGTKIKANASKVVEKNKIEKEHDQLEKNIAGILEDAESIDKLEDETYGPESSGDELPEELQDAKKRKEKLKAILDELEQAETDKLSLADKDARFMKSKGGIRMSYNGQCATENQFILAYDLSNAKSDADQLIPMVQQLENLSQQVLQKEMFPLKNVRLVADAGYDSGKNLTYINEQQIDGYVCGQKDDLKAKEQKNLIEPRPFSKDKFTYHSQGDYYQCPNGEKLIRFGTGKKVKKTYTRTEVIYCAQSCHQCCAQKECVKSKTGFRHISRYPQYDPYREDMQEKLSGETGKRMLHLRRCDVEPTFGQLKQAVFRYGPFLLRSIQKTKGEFGIGCIAHNLKKIAKIVNSNENDLELANISR